MPVRRDKRTRQWFFRTTIKFDGKKVRISGTPGVPGPYHGFPQTKDGAKDAEMFAIQRAMSGDTGAKDTPPAKKEVPTFNEWWNGRYWTEWVVSKKNKPSTVAAKKSIMKNYLEPEFGEMPLNMIIDGPIAQFRAKLVEAKLSDKTINEILGVLSKPLKYAEKVRVIEHAPSVGMLKVERPEIIAWSVEEYAAILRAAKSLDPLWYAATCLAGEASLRIGEIRALDWQRDVDLVAGTLTVNRQRGLGVTTTPKGRTRRTIPMTSTLLAALESLDMVRTGYVIRHPDGSPMTDGDTKHPAWRICRTAGLPERGWHTLRHSFGTHAAMFGVNPWKLMMWMGHKRVDETMLYVHFAEAHMRPHAEPILAAQRTCDDPDRRIIAMLAARRLCVPCGSHAAADSLELN